MHLLSPTHDLLPSQSHANYVEGHNRISGKLGTLVPGMADASIERLRKRQASLAELVSSGLGPGNNTSRKLTAQAAAIIINSFMKATYFRTDSA